MLPRAHRLSDGRELNNTVRSGTRFGCRNFVVSTFVDPSRAAAPARFGFIVSKKVGNAVTRNLVKRRLREAAWSVIATDAPAGVDVVVRALPASVEADYPRLMKDLRKGMRRTGALPQDPAASPAPEAAP